MDALCFKLFDLDQSNIYSYSFEIAMFPILVWNATETLDLTRYRGICVISRIVIIVGSTTRDQSYS